MRWKLKVVPWDLLWAKHLRLVGKLLVHVQGVLETTAQVVDWVLLSGSGVDWQFILLVVEVGGDGGSTDVDWSPSRQMKMK